MLRLSLILVSLTLVACGNSTGSTAVNTDDASGGDLQIDGTDAIVADIAGTDASGYEVLDVTLDAQTDIVSGTDASSPDVPIAVCKPVYEGSIPGASIDLSKTPCTFSISAAKGVFNLNYAVNVATSQKLSVGGNLAGCPPQPESIHGGVTTFEVIDGGASQKWCVCDTGLCAPVEPPFTATTPGSYDVPFTWDGNNWYGPSDTGNKPGPAFPTGSYTFTVSITGNHQKADGSTETFTASAKLPITLTP